jgi:hypothetical protein
MWTSNQTQRFILGSVLGALSGGAVGWRRSRLPGLPVSSPYMVDVKQLKALYDLNLLLG